MIGETIRVSMNVVELITLVTLTFCAGFFLGLWAR